MEFDPITILTVVVVKQSSRGGVRGAGEDAILYYHNCGGEW